MYKDIEVQKKYQRDWYKNKKAGIPTRTRKIYTKEERKILKTKRDKKAQDKERNRRRNLIKEQIGDSCYFCHKENDRKYRLASHRKDGILHEDLLNCDKAYFDKEIKDMSRTYVRFCIICHRGTHWCMKNMKLNWGQIEKMVMSN